MHGCHLASCLPSRNDNCLLLYSTGLWCLAIPVPFKDKFFKCQTYLPSTTCPTLRVTSSFFLLSFYRARQSFNEAFYNAGHIFNVYFSHLVTIFITTEIGIEELVAEKFEGLDHNIREGKCLPQHPLKSETVEGIPGSAYRSVCCFAKSAISRHPYS